MIFKMNFEKKGNVEILVKLFIYDGKPTQYFVWDKNWKLAIIH